MVAMTTAEPWPAAGELFTVDELRDGRYEQVAHVTGNKPFRAQKPFPMEIVPSQLVARLLPE